MAILSVFCRHYWGFPLHGKYTCMKCGRVRVTEAIEFDADRDRVRIQAARMELERELATKPVVVRRIA